MKANCDKLFVTATGNPVVKIYDDINRVLKEKNVVTENGKPLIVSASTFRKMAETAGQALGTEERAGLAKALHHTELTAARHYVIPSAEEAVRRQNLIQKVQDTANLNQYIKQQ